MSKILLCFALMLNISLTPNNYINHNAIQIRSVFINKNLDKTADIEKIKKIYNDIIFLYKKGKLKRTDVRNMLDFFNLQIRLLENEIIGKKIVKENTRTGGFLNFIFKPKKTASKIREEVHAEIFLRAKNIFLALKRLNDTILERSFLFRMFRDYVEIETEIYYADNIEGALTEFCYLKLTTFIDKEYPGVRDAGADALFKNLLSQIIKNNINNISYRNLMDLLNTELIAVYKILKLCKTEKKILTLLIPYFQDGRVISKKVANLLSPLKDLNCDDKTQKLVNKYLRVLVDKDRILEWMHIILYIQEQNLFKVEYLVTPEEYYFIDEQKLQDIYFENAMLFSRFSPRTSLLPPRTPSFDGEVMSPFVLPAIAKSVSVNDLFCLDLQSSSGSSSESSSPTKSSSPVLMPSPRKGSPIKKRLMYEELIKKIRDSALIRIGDSVIIRIDKLKNFSKGFSVKKKIFLEDLSFRLFIYKILNSFPDDVRDTISIPKLKAWSSSNLYELFVALNNIEFEFREVEREYNQIKDIRDRHVRAFEAAKDRYETFFNLFKLIVKLSLVYDNFREAIKDQTIELDSRVFTAQEILLFKNLVKKNIEFFANLKDLSSVWENPPILSDSHFIIKPWERFPQYDIYQGSMGYCCFSMAFGENRHYMLDWLVNYGRQCIELVDIKTNRTIAQFDIMLFDDDALLIDNISGNGKSVAENKLMNIVKRDIFLYTANFAKLLGRTKIYLGVQENIIDLRDVPKDKLPPSENEHDLAKRVRQANIFFNSFYLDSAGGVIRPGLSQRNYTGFIHNVTKYLLIKKYREDIYKTKFNLFIKFLFRVYKDFSLEDIYFIFSLKTIDAISIKFNVYSFCSI